jgi:hypothetical protein
MSEEARKLRDQAIEKIRTRYETDGARLAAYEGFLLGEWVGLFADWNVQMRDPKTGLLESVPRPPMPVQ